jgi:hypothetical protein
VRFCSSLLAFPLIVALQTSVGSQVCYQHCPLPVYETCDANRGTNEFQNCLARNRREDARYYQCKAQERRECERERKEQEKERQEKAHEQYCQQHPDAADCK